MNISPIDQTLVAAWPPKTANRQYAAPGSKKPISSEARGSALPAKKIVGLMGQVKEDRYHAALLDSTRLYVDLPAPFFEAFLNVQHGLHPIDLPKIKENKNKTVLSCFADHPAYSLESGPLHVSKWEALGWSSKQAYQNWLNTSMLFAFSHCMHYCSAPRVFEADVEKNKKSKGKFHFKQVMTDAHSQQKKTNILSVTGFEYRNFQGSIAETLDGVRQHSNITMKQILLAAAQTNTTDIVLIPYGMGVFIPKGPDGDAIKEATFQGMIDALRDYQGPPVTIQCCGWPDFYNRLNSSGNANIHFENKCGYDAYTIANNIQDRGIKGEMAHEKPLKSMLINAADNDWTALLDPQKVPGQFSDGHTLFYATSDEYYALVMGFAYFSIQRMKDFFKDTFGNKIVSVNDHIPLKPDALDGPSRESLMAVPQQSCLSTQQIEEIDDLIRNLNKEINSRWKFNKPLKQRKIDALNALKRYAETAESISEAIQLVDDQKKFKEWRKGHRSHRTDDLIQNLLSKDLSLHAGRR